MDTPIFIDGYKDDNSDCGRFDHRTEGFTVAKASYLVKTFSYQPGLAPVYGTIQIFYDLIHPLAADWTSIC